MGPSSSFYSVLVFTTKTVSVRGLTFCKGVSYINFNEKLVNQTRSVLDFVYRYKSHIMYFTDRQPFYSEIK